VLLRHVLPNAIAPVIAVATVSLGTFIVAEATLSFLGIGLPPTVMSWGNDINAARQSLTTSPMVLIYPAAALSVTVLSFLMLGDVVRDALDPKERARRLATPRPPKPRRSWTSATSTSASRPRRDSSRRCAAST